MENTTLPWKIVDEGNEWHLIAIKTNDLIARIIHACNLHVTCM